MAEASTTDGVGVRRNDAALRYEAWSDGVLAGRLEFGLTERDIVFTHTEVDEQFQGRGIGSALIRQALDDVRRRGDRTVVAGCAMVRAWMRRHPDYRDLLRAGDAGSTADQDATSDEATQEA